ncbi:MAG: ABC transporter ATP-binding protein [Lachnospiraceae bacterium]|nr:ABC transporter ATP-binding protein [Lachnospiraceae bacterium]
MTEAVLQISDLSAGYGQEQVLSQVSLTLHQGEVLCVAGESGSGKSTLLQVICGNHLPVSDADRAGRASFLRIESGSVRFQGEELTVTSPSQRRKRMGTQIGLIPQNPAGSFNPVRRLDAQFRETLKSHGIAYDRGEIVRVFDSIGLSEPEKLLRCRPYELSGGMNQRIAVAFAMLLAPTLLLCDEVTSALDVTTAITVIDELLKLKRERNMTMLFVTHHLGIAREIADRIAIMHRGRIVEEGPAKELLAHPSHEYTGKLLRDVPRMAEM